LTRSIIRPGESPLLADLRNQRLERRRLQLATFPLGMRLHSMLPGYTPRKHHVPDGIAKLSAQFTQLAESVR
jgi:hypothetical protein